MRGNPGGRQGGSFYGWSESAGALRAGQQCGGRCWAGRQGLGPSSACDVGGKLRPQLGCVGVGCQGRAVMGEQVCGGEANQLWSWLGGECMWTLKCSAQPAPGERSWCGRDSVAEDRQSWELLLDGGSPCGSVPSALPNTAWDMLRLCQRSQSQGGAQPRLCTEETWGHGSH